MATTYGNLSAASFGVPVLSGWVVSSYSTATKPEVIVEVLDETGKRTAVRYDGTVTETTIDLICNGGVSPTVGGTLTYNTQKYEVLSVDVKGGNKEYTKTSVKLKTTGGVSL